MSIVTRILVLTGARAGLTVKLGMYQFTDGKIPLRGSAPDVEAMSHWMAVNYAAYPEGSDELEAANGQCDLSKTAKSDSQHAVLGEVQPSGARTEAAPTDDRGGSDGADEGEADGPVPEGYGHRYTRIHRLQEVLNQLDPDNDAQWTATGLPSVGAVRALFDDSVSRADITEAAPNLTQKG